MNANTLPDALRITERLREHYAAAEVAFDGLSTVQQLDAIDIACRSPFYVAARKEALLESDDYEALLVLATDSSITDNELGRSVREILIAYMQRAAVARGENLIEFAL